MRSSLDIAGTSFIPRGILVRGVNWLGDAVMTTPALARLRERFPSAHVTLLSHRKLAELWEGQPLFDEVMIFESGDSLGRTARRLKERTFDLAVVLPNSPRAALEAWLARIPVRVGRSTSWRRAFLTHPVNLSSSDFAMPKRTRREVLRILSASGSAPSDREKLSSSNPAQALGNASASAVLGAKRHHVHQYLEVVQALGGRAEATPPKLTVSTAEETAVAEKFGLSSAVQWIGVNAGAEYGPAKRWPLESFARTIAMILGQSDHGILLLGGSADANAAATIAQEASIQATEAGRIKNLAGKTSLKELCAVLRRCSVVLTNDTGPMHVAAAVGTPLVAIFGSTEPAMTGPGLPGSPRVRILRNPTPCAPCFLRDCPIDLRCLTGIDASDVARAVLDWP